LPIPLLAPVTRQTHPFIGSFTSPLISLLLMATGVKEGEEWTGPLLVPSPVLAQLWFRFKKQGVKAFDREDWMETNTSINRNKYVRWERLWDEGWAVFIFIVILMLEYLFKQQVSSLIHNIMTYIVLYRVLLYCHLAHACDMVVDCGSWIVVCIVDWKMTFLRVECQWYGKASKLVFVFCSVRLLCSCRVLFVDNKSKYNSFENILWSKKLQLITR
jgi:hypothetical protein